MLVSCALTSSAPLWPVRSPLAIPSIHQNLIFRFLQSRQKIQVWLYDHTDLRIEGRIVVRTHLEWGTEPWGCLSCGVIFYLAIAGGVSGLEPCGLCIPPTS